MDIATPPDSEGNAFFRSYTLLHGLLADLREDQFPTTLSAWAGDALRLTPGATHFGYVYEGNPSLIHGLQSFTLSPGMYFSAYGEGTLLGAGRGIIVSRIGFKGVFQIGGPVETEGRLKYIDGCTDSLLIPPTVLGDPCLNLLHFPPNVFQTRHTHPSMRVGMVIRGKGQCNTPTDCIPLVPGGVFVIPAGGLHGFQTSSESMTVIAYHPDSDFGPTDEFHPMINRTMVDGVSANRIQGIMTK